ncbi:hypothetical protein [Haloprofundus salilacus]|uniref:hypothetical protein n=1 Tax=Haloprofundus salilacus TaxID=2876190 RepID=UPI001CCE7D65|nr:hypothetical protein [Haloprofundus salilacus]
MSIKRTNQMDLFFRMAREFPVRTGIFTFGLPLFALLQLINGIVYGGSLPLIGLFAALTAAYSVHVTTYHVAAYRREQLAQEWIENN